jgi:hypothetical protein
MNEERKPKIEKMMPALITGFAVGIADVFGRNFFDSTWPDFWLKLATVAALAAAVALAAQMGVRAFLRRS